MTKNLTEGNPFKLIIEFSIPILLGLLFQQCYTLMDTMIVGRTLGAHVLAAVGSTGSLNFMIIKFCVGICTGFAILMSQAFGAQDEKLLKKYIGNSISLGIIISISMALITGLFSRNILEIMNTPTDIIDYAHTYIRILFFGIPVTVLYNMTSSMIRSVGDSKTPVKFLMFSSVINIILDLFFILVLKMGVAGAALATVISQGISGLLCVWYIKKNFEVLHPTKQDLALDNIISKKLLTMGIPMGLQYSITAIGSIVLQVSINGLGTIFVASMTAGNKMSAIFCCVFDALGATIATYAGQNVGAKRLDRVLEGVKDCMIIGSIYALCAFTLFYFKGEFFAGLFVDGSNVEVIANAKFLLVRFSAFYIPLCIINVLRYCIQGMGYSKVAIFSGVAEMLARFIVAFGLVPYFGFVGVSWSNPLAWIFADLFLIPCFMYTFKKTGRELGLNG